MEVDDHEWELSKENVQPLRQGRQISSLVAALHPDQEEERNIKAQQHEFELELRTYAGDDPYVVWDRYIKWTEQNYPKGGHDGQLMKLIERCLREFQGDERYKNDPRFIRMWIKFACLSEDPTDLFVYMFDNSIGDKVAALYIEWAMNLERQGDSKKADAIYIEGLNRCAEPKDLLVQKQQEFQYRVARNITLQIAETQNPGMDMGEGTAQRSALGKLKGSGKSHKVGTTRTGTALLGSAGSLRDTRPVAPKQVPGQGIPIFTDAENVPHSLQPPQTKEWQSMPVRSVDNRENDKDPGVWRGAKIKQKPGAIASGPAGMPFEIHKDPEAEKAWLETPRKTTLINTQPLSSRKAARTDVLSNLKQTETESTALKLVPAYDKDKVYNGICEFSFEELRAAKYWKLRKEREAEEERLKKEEERKQREQMMEQQLKVTTERLSAIEALLRNHLSGLNMNSASGQQISQLQAMAEQASGEELHQHIQPETQQPHQTVQNHRIPGQTRQDNKEVFVPEQQAVDPDFVTPDQAMNLKRSGFGGSQNTSLNGSLKTPIFNSASSYSAASSGGSLTSSSHRSGNTLVRTNSSTTTPSDLESNLSARPVSTASVNNVSLSSLEISAAMSRVNRGAVVSSSTPMNVDDPPTDSFLSNSVPNQNKQNRTVTPKSGGPTPDSMNSSGIRKGGLSAPSPTVYTKEAMQCVMGMFSSSFTCDNQPASEEIESFTGAVPTAQPQPLMHFEICEDTTGVLKPESQHSDRGHKQSGLQIFCDDKENASLSSDCPKSQVKSSGSAAKGLQIYRDEPQDENFGKPVSVKKGARRGLGFLPTSGCEDVEMTDMDKELHHMNNDFTIECQARSDMTLAPLDSFRIQARAASTPCVNSQDKSHVQVQEVSGSASSCSSNSAATVNDSEAAPTPNKHLSPIFEGSGEGSGEDSKSQTASGICPNVTTRSRHGSSRNCASMIAEETEIDDMAGDDRAVDVSDNQVLDRSCHHQIDTTAYIPELENDIDDLLSMSVCLDPADPFDEQTVAQLLKMLDPPLTEYTNYIACDGELPDPSVDFRIELNGLYIMATECVGEGGYAKIFKISEIECDETLSTMEITGEGEEKVIKVQSPPAYWEFYVSCELKQRLTNLPAEMDVTPSIMHIQRGFFFKNRSALEMNYVPFGSLLNLVNKYKNNRERLAEVESLACLLTIELLHLFEQIHKNGFIHGDVKPDNFLFKGLPGMKKESGKPRDVFGSKLSLLQLIDFGQSMDLTKFPRDTKFMAKIVTSGFQCIEMRTNRPWTFQTDLFGLAGTVHVVLFGSYMKVFQEHGTWRITGSFTRKWNVPLWKRFFQELLNIPSCEQQPDLAALREEFEQHFMQNLIPSYNSWVEWWRTKQLRS